MARQRMIPGTSASDSRSAYRQLVETKLAEKKALLVHVKRGVESEANSGRILLNEQLRNAERQADACLADLERFVGELDSVDDESWENKRLSFEVAWEDFSQSIQRFVARIS